MHWLAQIMARARQAPHARDTGLLGPLLANSQFPRHCLTPGDVQERNNDAVQRAFNMTVRQDAQQQPASLWGSNVALDRCLSPQDILEVRIEQFGIRDRLDAIKALAQVGLADAEQ